MPHRCHLVTASPATPPSPPYASQANTSRFWQSHGLHHCPPRHHTGSLAQKPLQVRPQTYCLSWPFLRKEGDPHSGGSDSGLFKAQAPRGRVLDGMSARIGLVARLPRHHTRPSHLAHVHIVPIYREFGVHHRVLPCMLRVICGFQKKRRGLADRHPGAFFQFSFGSLVLRVAM